MGVSLFSIVVAISVCVLGYCLLLGKDLWTNTKFFVEDGRSERMLYAAITCYLREFYPALLCDCELYLVHEHMTKSNKYRFRVTFHFDCHETCHAHDKNVAFLVDVSDMNEFEVIQPINDDAIAEYKKERV